MMELLVHVKRLVQSAFENFSHFLFKDFSFTVMGEVTTQIWNKIRLTISNLTLISYFSSDPVIAGSSRHQHSQILHR